MTNPTDRRAAQTGAGLRAAIDQLRALATAASTDRRGPTAQWFFKETDHRRGAGYLYSANPTGPGVRLTHGGSSGAHGRGSHPGMHIQHGVYAATMDPTVGLAIATLLESVLHGAWEAGHEACASDCTPETCELAAARAVAHLITRKQRGEQSR
ncbi:hypothetical protein ACF1BS_14810 [Streptomyces sp. NPDC014748]|uniref:hypothetical protein n=1 Tax=Streptomyces sp. NPDC014748 TaxID=3364905 RepID=UPI00370261E2